MAEPKGKLVTPVAFDPLGVPHALDTVSGGILKNICCRRLAEYDTP